MIRFRAPMLGLLALALSHPQAARCMATGADFLLIEPSARAVAGGGAFAASLSGLDSLSYNPAGLSGLGQSLQTSLSHIQSFGGWQHDSAAIGFPMWGLELAAEFNTSRLQPFPVYDDLGNQAGTAGAGSLVYGLSCGSKPVAKRLWSGLRARGFSSELAGYTNWGLAVDAGLIYQPLDRFPLRLGFSFQNLGFQNAYVEAADPLPLLYRLGAEWAAYQDKHYSATAKADLVLHAGDNRPDQGRAGVELRIYQAVFASAGLQMDPVRGMHTMFGAGMKFAGLGISYAYLPHETLGTAHRLSLDYQFALAAAPATPAPPTLEAYAYPGGFALQWTPAPATAACNIYFKDSSGHWTKWTPVPIRGDRLSINSPRTGQTYTAIIKAVGPDGHEGAASNEVNITTK